MINNFENEINALIHAPIQDVVAVDPEVAAVIKSFRNGTLEISSGGGGRYGEIIVPE